MVSVLFAESRIMRSGVRTRMTSGEAMFDLAVTLAGVEKRDTAERACTA